MRREARSAVSADRHHFLAWRIATAQAFTRWPFKGNCKSTSPQRTRRGTEDDNCRGLQKQKGSNPRRAGLIGLQALNTGKEKRRKKLKRQDQIHSPDPADALLACTGHSG
jgi:hypothetical protein